MHLNGVIISLTTAQWAARTKTIPKRQLGFNSDTGEFRQGGDVWDKCLPVNLRAHTEVVAATIANITRASALNNGDTLDGVVLATGDLVLVKDQTNAEENGVYTVGASPARATAYDTWAEHIGKRIYVAGGTTNKKTYYTCNVVSGGTLDTTDIGWDLTPMGPLNLGETSVADQLPKGGITIDGTAMFLMFDPTTNQWKTITITDLATILA